ncbi:MAG: hypothetical protein ACUVWZ_03515 [Anaerolineae bacterium]
MIERLRRLISPEYLIVNNPGPLGGLWPLYAILGVFFVGGFAVALWTFTKDKRAISPGVRTWAWLQGWICLTGLGTVIGRFLGWPGWSARVWPYSLAALALAGMLAYRFRRSTLPTWLAAPVRLLAFLPGAGQPPRKNHFLLGLLIHLIGMELILVAYYDLPWWTAPLVLLALLSPQIPLLARRQLPRLSALIPCLGAYLVTILWLFYRWQGITVLGWQGLAFPNPLVSLFYLDGIYLAAGTFSLLCQLSIGARLFHQPGIFWRSAIAGLLIVFALWAGLVYFGKRTHGATASDPYAYAQMAVDWAERGTFLHRFSLFQEVIPLKIAWAPLQPVGYHVPRNDLGDCPSVWPTGASALLAIGYKFLGEAGLYITTPILALLSLAATWFLVQEVLYRESRPIRHLSSTLAVILLATSPEQVDRLLVPMADAAAQLFTTLTLLFALRVWRGHPHRHWYAASMGVCLAWANWVRHTQLVLALPAIWIVIPSAWRKRASSNPAGDSFGPLLTFCGAALFAALPDIVYRWQVFGSPLAAETTELPLMSLRHVAPVAGEMLQAMLAAGEWGYLFPLALYGAYLLARRHAPQAMILGSAFALVLLVHLTYRSLRLRDLLSLFPLLNLTVGYGAVCLVYTVRTRLHRGQSSLSLGQALLAVSMIFWVILSLALARWAMIDNVWKRGWASFGYMRAEQRAALNRLAELTPPEAIISASLNAGAITLYTGRDAIRPYDSWTEIEWEQFLEAMRIRQRPVYLLDDGGPMAQFIAREQTRHRLTPIEELRIPLFYTRDRETGWLYRLEWEP